MPITHIERLRHRAVHQQLVARSAFNWLEPLLVLDHRPLSFKMDDQAYRARCYEQARKTFEEYERATLYLATP